jgi:hypothetical protein
VGIKTEVVFEELGLFRARRQANPQEWDVMSQGNGTLTEEQQWQSVGSFGISVLYWQPWSLWLTAYQNIYIDQIETLEDDYDGVMPGIEPPQWVKDIRFDNLTAMRSDYNSDVYLENKKKMWDLQAEYLMVIGTVGKLPQVQITSDDLVNTYTGFPPGAGSQFDLNRQLMMAFFK